MMNSMDPKIHKKLLRIARSAQVSIRMIPNPRKVSEADPKEGQVWVYYDPEKHVRFALSDFFHELAHVFHYRLEMFPGYYASEPTREAIEAEGLQAELDADNMGERLMRKFFPEWKFVHTYRYKKWQDFHRKYWGLE